MVILMSNISISRYKDYTLCPKLYEEKHLNKLVPTYTSSSLLFGRGIDKGLDAILTDKDGIAAFINEFPFELSSPETI